MALNPGTNQAASGLSKAIYDAMKSELGSSFPNKTPPDDVAAGWKKPSFAIAQGVVAGLRKEPLGTPADPSYADTYSSKTSDTYFWDWLAGFVNVIKTTDGASLKTAMASYIDGGHAVPAELKGILR